MFSDRYLLEKFLRWTFSIGLVAVLALSFFNSELYRRTSWWLTGQPASDVRCQMIASRDIEHTATLGHPQLESLIRKTQNLGRALLYVNEACKHDPSLTAVYLRQVCGDVQQLSHAVTCP